MLSLPKSSVILFQKIVIFSVQLICEYLNWQFTITTYHLPSLLDFNPAWWRPLAPEVIFTSFHPSMNFLCNSKTRRHGMVLPLYNSWSILSACNKVFHNRTKHFKFIRGLMFIVCSSVFTDEQPEKRVSIKACAKRDVYWELWIHKFLFRI